MNIFQDYYESKLALDILTKEVENKKQEVIKVLLSLPDNKTVIPGAKFSLRASISYKFSGEYEEVKISVDKIINFSKNNIKEAQARLKLVEQEEIAAGKAEILKTIFVPVMTITK